MKCGDIVLVNYPFTDQSGSKVRPAIIVSADRFNNGEDLVVAAISSVPRHLADHTYHLSDEAPYFVKTGLNRDSYIRLTKLATLARSVICRRLGHLEEAPLAEIRAKIARVFQ